MSGGRTVLLLPAEGPRVGEELWAVRDRFAPAEVHLRDAAGRFLPGRETRQRLNWPGAADYEGGLVEALDEGRVGLVISLLGLGDGSLQGFLEFAGVTYVGCGLTAAVLATDPDFWQAVAGVPGASEGVSQPVAVLGSRSPQTASHAGPEAERAAREFYQHLGLAGWALIHVARTGSKWTVHSLEVQPPWSGPFGDLMAERGLTLGSQIQNLIDEARTSHAADAGLRNHYKDRI